MSLEFEPSYSKQLTAGTGVTCDGEFESNDTRPDGDDACSSELFSAGLRRELCQRV